MGNGVKLMISTGNHDIDAWGGRWRNFIETKMLAERFNYKGNPKKTDIPGECLFSAAELPPGNQILFTVTPRDCFGLAGKPLTGKISCQRL